MPDLTIVSASLFFGLIGLQVILRGFFLNEFWQRFPEQAKGRAEKLYFRRPYYLKNGAASLTLDAEAARHVVARQRVLLVIHLLTIIAAILYLFAAFR
ncbi:hypothetical protein KUV46_03720 [Thalassovita mediterranea]|nr:hypothetical protein KUV46_03720 [Thalassovita mediterranea]